MFLEITRLIFFHFDVCLIEDFGKWGLVVFLEIKMVAGD